MKSSYSDKERFIHKDLNSKKHLKMKKLLLKRMNFSIIYIFFLTLLFQNSQSKSISEKPKNFSQFHSYEITIKIQGTGTQNILASDYYKCPDSVYRESSRIGPLSSDCHLINIPASFGETNYLRLVWTNTANSFYNMFQGLKNILEADLSKYDTSAINDMHQMFNNCTGLT